MRKYPKLNFILWAILAIAAAACLFYGTSALAEDGADSSTYVNLVSALPAIQAQALPVVEQVAIEPIGAPPFAFSVVQAISIQDRGSLPMGKVPFSLGEKNLGSLQVIGNVDIMFGFDEGKLIFGGGLSGTGKQDGKGANVGLGYAQKIGLNINFGWVF